VGREHPAHPRPPLALDAVRPAALGDAARDGDPRAAGVARRGAARVSVERAGGRDAALRGSSRHGARVLGHRDGRARPARGDDLARLARDARDQHRGGHAVARRASERVAAAGGGADPRRRRARRSSVSVRSTRAITRGGAGARTAARA
jgi:hypothetical protein